MKSYNSFSFLGDLASSTHKVLLLFNIPLYFISFY
jgi:hypothetical protein